MYVQLFNRAFKSNILPQGPNTRRKELLTNHRCRFQVMIYRHITATSPFSPSSQSVM